MKLIEEARKDDYLFHKGDIVETIEDNKQFHPEKTSNDERLSSIYDQTKAKVRVRRSADNNISSKSLVDDDELRLVKYLMDSYNKEVRPVINKKNAVEVVFGLAYTQLLDLVSLLQIHSLVVLLSVIHFDGNYA